MSKVLLIIVLVLLICVGFSSFFYKNKTKSVVTDNTEKKVFETSSGPVAFKDFNISEYKGDCLISIEGKWLGLESREMVFFKTALVKDIAVKDIKVTFKEKDKIVSTITANKAVLKIPSGEKDIVSGIFKNDIVFSKNVKLVTNDRKVLLADRLVWDTSDDSLVGSGRCSIRDRGKLFRYNVVQTDLRLDNYRMKTDKKQIFTKIADNKDK